MRKIVIIVVINVKFGNLQMTFILVMLKELVVKRKLLHVLGNGVHKEI
jgi:hypothetical protein